MPKICNIRLPGDWMTALEELRDFARLEEGRAVTPKSRGCWSVRAEAMVEAIVDIAAADAVADYETPGDRALRREARGR